MTDAPITGDARARPDAGRVVAPAGSLPTLLAAVLLLAFGWIALVALLIAYRPFNMPSASMTPTLMVGDHFMVSKLAYGLSRASMPLAGILPVRLTGRYWAADPKRGDLVVFKLPSDGRTDYIKRVVGLPGETIQLVGGMLTIDGKTVERERIGDHETEDLSGAPKTVMQFVEHLPGGVSHRIIEMEGDAGFLDDTPKHEVPPGHVFVLGDNRDNSVDSRDLNRVGFVPFENLVGRAEFIYASVANGGSAGPLGLRWDRMFKKID